MKYLIVFGIVTATSALGNPLASSDIVVTRSTNNATNNAALAELDARQITCTYTGWSGAGCTGTAGDVITYDERCIYARGSHSFYISAGCPTMFVGIYVHKKCENGGQSYVNVPGGTCHDVNTGHAWLSTSWTAT